MRIAFTTDGGLAAFPGLARPLTLDVDASPDAARWRWLVARAGFFQCAEPSGPTAGAADSRRCEVTLDDGARRRTLTLFDQRRIRRPMRD